MRGEVLFKAADCVACHTDSPAGGAPLAGGRALSTPFGVFYGPNITPDRAVTLLATGETPDFDFVGSGMREVVAGTAALSAADRRAIAVYIKSLPAR